mgnify:CR=1 FL=1
MKLISSFFTIPKKGSTPKENEDFFYPHEAEIRRDHPSMAIADGASEGMLSGQWAQILVRAFCRSGGSPDTLGPLLERAYLAWRGWAHDIVFSGQDKHLLDDLKRAFKIAEKAA